MALLNGETEVDSPGGCGLVVCQLCLRCLELAKSATRLFNKDTK